MKYRKTRGKQEEKEKRKIGKRGKGYKKGKGQTMKTRKRIGEKGEMRKRKEGKKETNVNKGKQEEKGRQRKAGKKGGKGKTEVEGKGIRGKSKNKCIFVSEFRDLYTNLIRHLG